MSEPVKHSEIEDVLSSIRRLVSDTHRQPLKAAGLTAKANLDRLVLTDALRVPELDTPADDPSDDVSNADTAPPEADEKSLDAEVPSATVDHFVFAPRARGNADRSAGSDAVADSDRSDAGEPARDPLFGAEEPVETAEPAPDDADPVDDAVNLRAEEADAAEDDGETQAPADDSERPMFEGVASEFTEDDEAPWSDPETTLYEAAGMALGADEDPDDNPDDIRPLTEKIAALEEVIGQTEDQWEPDDPGTDDYAGTEVETLEWEDSTSEGEETGADIPMFRHTVRDDAADPVKDTAAPAKEPLHLVDEVAEPVEDAAAPVDEVAQPVEEAFEPVEETPAPVSEIAQPVEATPEPVEQSAAPAETAQETGDVTVQAASVSDPVDEATMDEAALRQLVAEIVREELQGVLGERITRNVRKLVRREIHRALTLQELD